MLLKSRYEVIYAHEAVEPTVLITYPNLIGNESARGQKLLEAQNQIMLRFCAFTRLLGG
jgi:hypothetical protein